MIARYHAYRFKMVHFGALSAFILLTICLRTASADSVSIRADEWYPINGTPGSENPGYMIELAQTILASAGHTVDYQLMPWERSIVKVREGDFDCVVGAYKDDAPDFVFPDMAWGKIESTFYVASGNSWQYNGLDSLEQVSLGTIGGYAYSDELDAYIEANQKSGKVQTIKANNALEQNIKKLIAGRIDATIESHLVMNAKLKELGLQDRVKSAGKLNEPDDMYIACSPAKPSSQSYAKLFSEGLKTLRASGKLKAILDKYGLQDWQ